MTTFSRTSRTVAIITAVVGGLVLAGIGASAAVAAVRSANFDGGSGTPGLQSVSTAGVTDLEIDSAASHFTLEFADVPEATLSVEGDSRFVWEMSVSRGELVVSKRSTLGSICIGWCSSGTERVTLTLPESLSNGTLEADLTVDAGIMIATGNFSSLDIELNAGSLTFDGAARTLDTGVNAGRATLTIADVDKVTAEVNAGALTTVFTGTPPRTSSLNVNAGSLDATFPDAAYRVTSDVEVGKFTNNLRESSSSRNLIDANVEVGRMVLQAR